MLEPAVIVITLLTIVAVALFAQWLDARRLRHRRASALAGATTPRVTPRAHTSRPGGSGEDFSDDHPGRVQLGLTPTTKRTRRS